MGYRYLRHFASEYEISHENVGHVGFGIWHIVGIVLGILILLAIIGLIIQYCRFTVQPTVGYSNQGAGFGAQQGVYY